MKTLDALFDDASGNTGWKDLSEDELLRTEFTVADPESLNGLTEEVISDDDPQIEFEYDMRARERKVRCVYCKWENHYLGIVVRSAAGRRNLVGRDCALSKHGVVLGERIREFDAAVERQSYARRKRNLLSMTSTVVRQFGDCAPILLPGRTMTS